MTPTPETDERTAVTVEAPENRCEAINEFAHRRCSREAVTSMTLGCVHEHIGGREICTYHAKALKNGQVYCLACAEVDDHKCSMNVIAEVAIHV